MEGFNLNPEHLRDAKNIECNNCEGIFFQEVHMFKKISKLLTGSPKDTVVPIPAYRCSDCGSVAEEFLPKFD